MSLARRGMHEENRRSNAAEIFALMGRQDRQDGSHVLLEITIGCYRNGNCREKNTRPSLGGGSALRKKLLGAVSVLKMMPHGISGKTLKGPSGNRPILLSRDDTRGDVPN